MGFLKRLTKVTAFILFLPVAVVWLLLYIPGMIVGSLASYLFTGDADTWTDWWVFLPDEAGDWFVNWLED